MGMLYKRGNTWWIKFYRAGRAIRESSGSAKEGDAKRLLRLREGDVERGIPLSPKVGRIRFEEAIADVVNDYRTNGKRSLKNLEQRIKNHLLITFEGRRMAAITTADVRTYIAKRQDEGAANATVNRETAVIKRAFTLAVQAGKLMARPHIPMLREDNTRQGFFEGEHFQAVLRHLPDALRPVVTFAYITGWRVPSEVLPLQWRQVDFKGGTVRLDPGSTKNGEGRVFPLTVELRAVLEAQREATRELGMICPYVFHRAGARIRDFRGAWRKACEAAGCPGRLPHDFRRTAIRNFEQKGISRSVAMKLTGHRTEAVYRRYAIVSESDLTEAARRLDGVAGTISGTLAPQAGNSL